MLKIPSSRFLIKEKKKILSPQAKEAQKYKEAVKLAKEIKDMKKLEYIKMKVNEIKVSENDKNNKIICNYIYPFQKTKAQLFKPVYYPPSNRNKLQKFEKYSNESNYSIEKVPNFLDLPLVGNIENVFNLDEAEKSKIKLIFNNLDEIKMNHNKRVFHIIYLIIL